jgi:hypothetical protein
VWQEAVKVMTEDQAWIDYYNNDPEFAGYTEDEKIEATYNNEESFSNYLRYDLTEDERCVAIEEVWRKE